MPLCTKHARARAFIVPSSLAAILIAKAEEKLNPPSLNVGVFISRKKEDRDDDGAEELFASTSRYVGGINNSPVSAIEDSIVAFVPRGPKSVRVTNLSLFRQKITRSNCPKSGSRAPLISRTEGTEILKHF